MEYLDLGCSKFIEKSKLKEIYNFIKVNYTCYTQFSINNILPSNSK